MRRLTTPKHKFTLPFSTSIIAKGRVVYAQDEDIVFAKETDECEMVGNTVSLKLTQEETEKLNCKKGFVEIQMHLLTHDMESLVSTPIKVLVKKCLDTEVLV